MEGAEKRPPLPARLKTQGRSASQKAQKKKKKVIEGKRKAEAEKVGQGRAPPGG